MSAINAVPFLSNAAGSDLTSLALKVYWGSFVEAFRPKTYVWDLVTPLIDRRKVESGKEFQFLMMADLPQSEEFTPGDQMLGMQFAVEEGTITKDGMLAQHHYLPKDQMHYSHFDVIGRIGAAHGSRMRRDYDRRLMITALLAARTAAVTKNGLTVHSGGNRVVNADGTSLANEYPLNATGAAALWDDFQDLARACDEDNIPPDQRFGWLTPYGRQVLQYDTTGKIWSKDYVEVNGARGIEKRHVDTIAGFKILDYPNTTTNNGSFPNQNMATADPTLPSKYQVNAGYTGSASATGGEPIFIGMCGGGSGQSAVGVAVYQDIMPEPIEWKGDRQCWFLATTGHIAMGVEHPWCACEIGVSAT